MTQPSKNRFEKHARLTMMVIWIIVLVSSAAALEWMLTPGDGRYAGTATDASPAPRRFLVMREWERNTDNLMGAPKWRRSDADDGGQAAYTLSTDDNGFVEPAIRHNDADLSIVFLGGSTTECLYVKPENRFPYLTAKTLETELGLKINGINAARSGNSTMHSLLLFLGKIAPIKPDFAVLMHATNDIGVLTSHGGYWTDNADHRLLVEKDATIGEGVRTIVNRLVPYTSRLLRRATTTVTGFARGPISGARAKDDGQAGNDDKAIWKRHGETFESALRSFVTAARSWKVQPVLMTQIRVEKSSNNTVDQNFIAPDDLARAGLDVERFGHIHDYFNAIIRRVAASENAILVDLATAREWKFGRDVYDPIHFTDAGSKAVASIVAKALKEHIASSR